MAPPITAQLAGKKRFDAKKWQVENRKDSEELDYAYSVIEAQRARIQELENLATRDELTGLSNRRGLLNILQKEQDRVIRDQSPGAIVVMIDLNNFKDINDLMGHDAGDLALRTVGNTLLGFIRSTDHAARVGGDEFIVLLSHTTSTQIKQRLRLLEQLLDTMAFKHNGRTIAVSSAIGYANLDGQSSVSELLKEADENMYAHKKIAHKNNKQVSRSRSESVSSTANGLARQSSSSQVHAS